MPSSLYTPLLILCERSNICSRHFAQRACRLVYTVLTFLWVNQVCVQPQYWAIPWVSICLDLCYYSHAAILYRLELCDMPFPCICTHFTLQKSYFLETIYHIGGHFFRLIVLSGLENLSSWSYCLCMPWACHHSSHLRLLFECTDFRQLILRFGALHNKSKLFYNENRKSNPTKNFPLYGI